MLGGILTYFLLPSRPAEAKFLTENEKAWVERELQREKQTTDDLSAIQALHNGRVWHLAFIGFAHAVGTYTISFWLPQVMNSQGNNRLRAIRLQQELVTILRETGSIEGARLFWHRVDFRKRFGRKLACYGLAGFGRTELLPIKQNGAGDGRIRDEMPF